MILIYLNQASVVQEMGSSVMWFDHQVSQEITLFGKLNLVLELLDRMDVAVSRTALPRCNKSLPTRTTEEDQPSQIWGNLIKSYTSSHFMTFNLDFQA